MHHFKRALREFNFLEATDVVSMEVNETYPKLQFVYRNSQNRRYHAIKFNEDVDDFVIKQISESKAFFKVESLRLAFNRISSDQMLCIVTLNVQGALSVRLMHESKSFLAESLINCLEEEDSSVESGE